MTTVCPGPVDSCCNRQICNREASGSWRRSGTRRGRPPGRCRTARSSVSSSSNPRSRRLDFRPSVSAPPSPAGSAGLPRMWSTVPRPAVYPSCTRPPPVRRTGRDNRRGPTTVAGRSASARAQRGTEGHAPVDGGFSQKAFVARRNQDPAYSLQGTGGAPPTWLTNSLTNHLRKWSPSGGLARVNR